jgi:hypothetical protein
MSANLARTAGMQLQMTAHAQIEPLAVQLLQRSILTQRGPWDAGLLAVRVDTNNGGESSIEQNDTNSSSSGDSDSSDDEAVHFDGAATAKTAVGCGADPSASDAAAEQQQQQQQRRLCVEFAAVHTSSSFAIGWMASDPEAALQVEFLRNDGHGPAAAAAAVAQPEEVHDGGLQQQRVPLQVPQVKCVGVSCSWPLA